MSRLHERLQTGQFVITTEMEPPKGTDLSHFLSIVQLLKGKVHAANVTDNQRAVMRLSSFDGGREGEELCDSEQALSVDTEDGAGFLGRLTI